MKRTITFLLLIAILVLSSCGQSVTTKSNETTSVLPETSASSPASPIATPTALAKMFDLPRETTVFASEAALTAVKPLYEEYISGNDMLAFAVSAVFNSKAYLMGFIYENNEYELPFSRVIGLTENGGVIEKAFVSDNYKNPEELVPENLLLYMDESPFYDTKAFNIDGMVVVKTAEMLSPESTLNNFFLINEEGLLDNYINTNIDESCELYEYNGKLLFNGNYLWYDFNVGNKHIVLEEIKDFSQYRPDIDKDDFVIELKKFKPGSHAEVAGVLKDDSYIELSAASKTLKKKDFKVQIEGDDWGVYPIYFSKRNFRIKTGTNIVLLYPAEMEIDCFVTSEVDSDEMDDFNQLSLPGVAALKAVMPGKYTVQISSDYEVYQIFITAK